MKVKERTTNEGMDPCNNRGAFGSLVVQAGVAAFGVTATDQFGLFSSGKIAN